LKNYINGNNADGALYGGEVIPDEYTEGNTTTGIGQSTTATTN